MNGKPPRAELEALLQVAERYVIALLRLGNNGGMAGAWMSQVKALDAARTELLDALEKLDG